MLCQGKPMADNHSPQVRSYNMSRIRNKDTKPEEIVRKHLFSKGFRYRKNDKRYSGKPDIVLPKYMTIIFIHGCFWHGHDCKRGQLPETNKSFWESKITKNKTRDQRNYVHLNEAGWDYLIIWGCEVKKRNMDNLIEKLSVFIGIR